MHSCECWVLLVYIWQSLTISTAHPTTGGLCIVNAQTEKKSAEFRFFHQKFVFGFIVVWKERPVVREKGTNVRGGGSGTGWKAVLNGGQMDRLDTGQTGWQAKWNAIVRRSRHIWHARDDNKGFLSPTVNCQSAVHCLTRTTWRRQIVRHASRRCCCCCCNSGLSSLHLSHSCQFVGCDFICVWQYV